MDIVTTLDRAGALGLQLTVADGRLNVTGSKTAEAAALVRQLATMKAAVIAHLTTPAPVAMAKEAAPIISLGPDVRRADLQTFVGQVVSDNDMMVLYYRAHRAGAMLTSEWLADTLPCDHRVTGYYPAP